MSCAKAAVSASLQNMEYRNAGLTGCAIFQKIGRRTLVARASLPRPVWFDQTSGNSMVLLNFSLLQK